MATELERARKRETKLIAVFSAIDARADAEAALGDALIELRGLGVPQADLAEMTGLSAREVGAAIRAAKNRHDEATDTPASSSSDADTEDRGEQQPDLDGAAVH